VVEVKVTPVGRVTPGGRVIDPTPLVIEPTSLVIDPTALVIEGMLLVMDAMTLDSSERIEEIVAVASLCTDEMMLEMLEGSVTPLVRELIILEASDTAEEMAEVAEAPTSLVKDPTALVIPEMIGTDENPGREGLKLVEPALTTEEIKPEGREVAVGSWEINELNAPVLTELAVVSCEIKEES